MKRNVVFLILLLLLVGCVTGTAAVYLSTGNMASVHGGFCCYGPTYSEGCGVYIPCADYSCTVGLECIWDGGKMQMQEILWHCAKNDMGWWDGTMNVACGPKYDCSSCTDNKCHWGGDPYGYQGQMQTCDFFSSCLY